jgi:hypothetical protein
MVPVLSGTNSPLANLPVMLSNFAAGSTAINSAVNSAFNSVFTNLVSPVSTFFGMPSQTNSTLPTSGLTSPFTTQFNTNSFANGFNNGFVSNNVGFVSNNVGFVGFGVAPTQMNQNFSTGFNNFVSTANEGAGFSTTPLGTIGFVGGVPVMSQ